MKIGFVAEPYEEHNASGMGYFISELLKQLLAQGAGNEFVIYSSGPVNKEFIPGNYRVVRLPRGFLRKMMWFWRMPDEVDALLFVTPLLPLILPRSVRAVVICQELANLKFPTENVSEKMLAFVRDWIFMPACFAQAEKIVAASGATKKDIIRFYKIEQEKIHIIHDGFQNLVSFASSAPSIEGALKPYFFFAGKVKPRKNVHGIVSAFIHFKKQTKSNCKLLIAGSYGGDYYESMKRSLADNGLLDDAHFLGYVTNPHLYSLYKNALACVYPSLNEGFGMPILESMSLGTPVITSSISSMPEIAGDSALLVDPFNVKEISCAMEKIYNDPAFRADLIQKGLARAKMFSWTKAADAYIDILRSL